MISHRNLVAAGLIAASLIVLRPVPSLAAPPANVAVPAYETDGNPTPSDIALATDYTKIADSLGDFQLAYVSRSAKGLSAEYMAKGESETNWSQRVLVQFSAAAPDPDTHERQVAKAIAGWSDLLDNKTQAHTHNRKITFETLQKSAVSPAIEPLHGAIFQYLVGIDARQVDNAGIIYPLPRPAGIVLLRLQKRNGANITAQDMKKMHRILNWSLATLNKEPEPLPNSKPPAAKAKAR